MAILETPGSMKNAHVYEKDKSAVGSFAKSRGMGGVGSGERIKQRKGKQIEWFFYPDRTTLYCPKQWSQ